MVMSPGALDTSPGIFNTFPMKKADFFTTVRLAFAPAFLILYMFPVWTGKCAFVSACIMMPLLGFAEFTDFLDGFFARREHAVSDFGKLFDPFADVVLHLTAFFCFAWTGYMPFIFLVLIFWREFGMIFIRMAAVKQGVAIAARKGGKLKTVLYISGILFSLAVESLVRLGCDLSASMGTLKIIAASLFGTGTLASYVSFIDYIVHFKGLFAKKE